MTNAKKLSIEVKSFVCSEKTPVYAKILFERQDCARYRTSYPSTNYYKERPDRFFWSDVEKIQVSENAGRKEKARAEFSNSFRPVHFTDDFIVDLRSRSPDNWAHALHKHLLLALAMKDKIKREQGGEVCVLLDRNSPQFINKLFELFKFKVFTHYRRVAGLFVNFEVEP